MAGLGDGQPRCPGRGRGLRVEVGRSGLFDPQVELVLGLVGSPSLARQAYAARKPGFAPGALADVHVPIGACSGNRLVNTGRNRWAVQLGLPMSRTFGRPLPAPDLAAIEPLSSVTLHGANEDSFGPAARTG